MHQQRGEMTLTLLCQLFVYIDDKLHLCCCCLSIAYCCCLVPPLPAAPLLALVGCRFFCLKCIMHSPRTMSNKNATCTYTLRKIRFPYIFTLLIFHLDLHTDFWNQSSFCSESITLTENQLRFSFDLSL